MRNEYEIIITSKQIIKSQRQTITAQLERHLKDNSMT